VHLHLLVFAFMYYSQNGMYVSLRIPRHQLQRELGMSLEDVDTSDAHSSILNTLDTSMFDLEPPITPQREGPSQD